jgi:hypothetical protein
MDRHGGQEAGWTRPPAHQAGEDNEDKSHGQGCQFGMTSNPSTAPTAAIRLRLGAYRRARRVRMAPPTGFTK